MTQSSPDRPVDPAEWAAALFTRSDGAFRFARWNRDIAPVIYGTDEAGTRLFEEAIRAAAGLTGRAIADQDAELGVNFLVFLTERWEELADVPQLDRLVPDLARLISVLKGAGANQYRIFGFDEAGGIKVCITLLRFDEDLARIAPQAVALSQAVQGLLLWSDHAFTSESPVVMLNDVGRAVIADRYAALIRAAYLPEIPVASADPALAGRLAALMRLGHG